MYPPGVAVRKSSRDSDPLDIPTALPIAAGVFEPSIGLVLRPEIAALSMSGSSLIVAVNALLLKRLDLPAPTARR